MSQIVRVALGVVAILALVVVVLRFVPSEKAPTNPQGIVGDAPVAAPPKPGPVALQRRPGFRNVTKAAGIDFRMNFLPNEQGETFKINLYDHGAGLAIGDCDGDGHDDIYFCNQLGSNALYRNNGEGAFEDITAQAGPVALEDRICMAATFADYDNDGDQDLYVTSVRGGNVLLQNNGQAKFRDVTVEAGVELVGHSQSGTFFDCELDGDLDLLVTNSASWTTSEFDQEQGYYVGRSENIFLSPKEYNVLYLNRGDGTFVDTTQDSGLAGRGWASDAVVLDYDDDGLPDVVITNMWGQAQLYRNQGAGRFHDVTETTLRRTSYGSVGARAFDFNNDGRLDVFLADMHSDMWMSNTPTSDEGVDESRKFPYLQGPLPERSERDAEIERRYVDALSIDYNRVLFGNTLFQNLGNGAFEEVSDRAGAETFWPWGIAAGDFDNDGFQDVFMPAGMGHPFFYWRNYLLMNNRDGTFRDQSRSRGIEPRPGGDFMEEPIGDKQAARSSRAAATADFDGDGRLDLVVNNFNEAPYYYRNEFPRASFVQFRLRGSRSNRDAIGAVMRLHLDGDEVMVRQVESAAGYLSQSSKTLHFGLGNRQAINKAEIRWPSGLTQTLERPAINTLHDIQEPVEPVDSSSPRPID